MSENEKQELLDKASSLTEYKDFFVTGINSLIKENSELAAENENRTSEIKALKLKLERMNELLLISQRAHFGQSSEKQVYVLKDLNQVDLLFNEAEEISDKSDNEDAAETVEVKGHKRKKRRTAAELLKSLPVKEVEVELPESERTCGICGSGLTQIGRKYVREELEVIPRQVHVIKYYTATYACEDCAKESDQANICSASVVPGLLKHSLASPSIVADVMTQKFVDGTPLYRQEMIWTRAGVALSRSTLANWVIQCARVHLALVYDLIRAYLRMLAVIYADETVIQVLKEVGKSPTSESRMWVYASGRYSERQIRLFDYKPDRKGENAAEMLGDFSGCLVSDGFSGYAKVSHATHCGCWAHMRRKWRDAMPKGATPDISKAAEGYCRCSKLFTLERGLADLDPEERKAARQKQVKPHLDSYWAWVDQLDPASGSKLSEAVTYARNQKDRLNEFMNHGEVDISNNIAENAIRPFVVGRKNWLFCDTPKGAEASAIVYTLVETAKANGLDPYKYLYHALDGLRRLARPASSAELERFLPWSPEMQAICKA